MLMGNTVDDITTDRHGQACPLDINASIRNCIGAAAKAQHHTQPAENSELTK
jgi:hypothetical protein